MDTMERTPKAEAKMTRSEFEKAAREANAAHEAERVAARTNRTACDVEVMFALGGAEYCRAHGVVGPCPFGAPRVLKLNGAIKWDTENEPIPSGRMG